MKRQHAGGVLLLTAVFGAACGASEVKTGALPTTTTTTVAPTTTVTTAPLPTTTTLLSTDPALAAKAKAAVLQPADFPTGFSPQPDEAGSGLGLEQLWSDLLRCLGVTASAPPAGIAVSPTFMRGLATQSRTTVEYTTVAVATAVTTALNGPKADVCLTEAFGADVVRSKPEGSTAGPASVAKQAVPQAGQQSMGWRVRADVHLDDLVVPLYQDFEVVVDRGTVIRAMFLNPGSEFPQDLEKSLVQKVVSRA